MDLTMILAFFWLASQVFRLGAAWSDLFSLMEGAKPEDPLTHGILIVHRQKGVETHAGPNQ